MSPKSGQFQRRRMGCIMKVEARLVRGRRKKMRVVRVSNSNPSPLLIILGNKVDL